ncbi:MAG TPA: hypothetical protein ENI08_01365, partial [Candidatus Dependentiae bacterium]|nr:hypothetical protein [Candidatus Dependentiae bacterium]
MVYGTGIVSDDFAMIVDLQNRGGLLSTLLPEGNFINIPVLHYTHGIFYYFTDTEHLFLINFLKTAYVILAFYMVSKFFSVFLNESSALTASFLFVFFPTHDSTNYFYLAQYLLLCFSFYLFAYYLAYKDQLIPAGIFATLASFISYGSPPVAFFLFILCLFKKYYKKAFVLLAPNIAFTFYYIVTSKIMAVSISRLPAKLHFKSLLKQFVFQIGSFIDAIIGPSFFLKVWYSILENSGTSIMLAVLFVVGYIMISKSIKQENQQNNVNKKLFAALIVLTLTSLAMFAVTGYYPQMAFNLGNRVTIYGSLLAAYLLVTIPVPQNVRRVVLLIFLVAIVGISAHWKQWNQHQMYVIDNIRKNKELASYDGAEPIYVSGNQYSRMGPFTHIEFLSEHFVVDSIFKLVGYEKLSARSLNKRFVYENGAIIDKKYNDEHPVGGTVMVYNSESDQLLAISAQ